MDRSIFQGPDPDPVGIKTRPRGARKGAIPFIELGDSVAVAKFTITGFALSTQSCSLALSSRERSFQLHWQNASTVQCRQRLPTSFSTILSLRYGSSDCRKPCHGSYPSSTSLISYSMSCQILFSQERFFSDRMLCWRVESLSSLFVLATRSPFVLPSLVATHCGT